MVIDERRRWIDGLGLRSQKAMLQFVMLTGNTLDLLVFVATLDKAGSSLLSGGVLNTRLNELVEPLFFYIERSQLRWFGIRLGCLQDDFLETF